MTLCCRRTCWIALTIAGAWLAYTAAQGPFAIKRSAPGRVVRFVLGSPGAKQDVDDLVDELSLPLNAEALRSWAEAVMNAQRTRSIPSDNGQYDGLIAWVPAPDIAPAPVLAHHRAVLGSSTPETYLHVDAEGHVVAVVLSWAHLRVGLVVVPGGSIPVIKGTFYERQPASNIRVFSTYS